MKKLILLLLFIPLVSLGQVKNGEIKTYYGSGELKSTGNYVNGLEQGEYKFYYESGKLKMEGIYADIDSLEFLLGKVIWQKSSRDYYVGVTFEGVYFDDEKNKIDAYRKATEKPIKGEVVAAGNGKILENGDIRALDVKVGDQVLFGKYAGTEVKVDGGELLVMKEDDIMAVIES